MGEGADKEDACVSEPDEGKRMKLNKAGQERGALEARGNSAGEADTSMEA